MPKVNVPCKCLSIIILDSIIKAKKKYYKLLLLTLWSLFMDGVQLLQGYSHFEEAVYFLPLEPPSGFEFWESSALTTRPLLQYYPQTLLEECKYESKKIKMGNLIDDDLEKSLSDESDNDSNDETESDNEKDNDESNEQFVKS